MGSVIALTGVIYLGFLMIGQIKEAKSDIEVSIDPVAVSTTTDRHIVFSATIKSSHPEYGIVWSVLEGGPRWPGGRPRIVAQPRTRQSICVLFCTPQPGVYHVVAASMAVRSRVATGEVRVAK